MLIVLYFAFAGCFLLAYSSYVFVWAEVILAATIAYFIWPEAWAFIAAEPITLLLVFVGYLLIGVLYTTFVFWPNFLKDNADQILHEYKKKKQYKENPPNYTNNVTDYVKPVYTKEDFIKNSNYRPVNHVDMIVLALTHWPSALLVDLLHRPAIWLYGQLSVVFYRIYARTMNKILNDE